MNGWICLHRQIQEHWIWKDHEMAYAWIDLLLLANHDDVKIPYKGRIVTCKRGEVNRSISWLADRWGWSRSRTQRFLKMLQDDGMIIINATTHNTTISLVKYDDFQYRRSTDDTVSGQQAIQQADSKRYTYNNVNNDNNETDLPNTTNLSNIEAPPTTGVMKVFRVHG